MLNFTAQTATISWCVDSFVSKVTKGKTSVMYYADENKVKLSHSLADVPFVTSDQKTVWVDIFTGGSSWEAVEKQWMKDFWRFWVSRNAGSTQPDFTERDGAAIQFTIVLVLVGDVNSAWASETTSFILAKYRYWDKLRYFDSPCEGSNILVGEVDKQQQICYESGIISEAIRPYPTVVMKEKA